MKLNHGVNIVAMNASWGSYGPYDSALADAIEAAGKAGIVCAAAGNGSANIDAAPFYPASFPSSRRRVGRRERCMGREGLLR